MEPSNTGNVLDPRLLPPGSRAQDASTYDQRPTANDHNSFGKEQPYYSSNARMSIGNALDESAVADQNEEGYSPGGAGKSPDGDDDSKRPRACEACRGLKVRCDQDPSRPDQPCKRCAKAGRHCVITQPSRKRQKKSDNRVADLEKKLDALTAALHAQQHAGASRNNSFENHRPASGSYSGISPADYPAYSGQSPGQYPQPASSDSNPSKKRRLDNLDPSLQTSAAQQSEISIPNHPAKDLPPHRWNTLDAETSERLTRTGIRRELYARAPEAIIARIREILDPALHEKIFSRFLHELLPNLPALAFPPGTTAREILESKPVLFLCIAAAASIGLVSPKTHTELTSEVTEVLADSVMRHGVKSLELVQAMTVLMLWSKPPEKPESPNFYLVIHMTACMALDLGLGRRFQPTKSRRGFGGPASNFPPGRLTALVDSDTLESRRTWLACYHLCASCAMSLRRPNLIRWSNYMQECVDILETSPEAAPSDRVFTQHVRIQKICEDISVSFQMDDASATSISITDPKVSYTLDVYEQKLRDWQERLPKDLSERPQLMFFYDVATLYLHEIAMHVNHNVDDFRLPFTEDTLKSGPLSSETLTQKQMAALEACLSAAQRIVSTYCTFGFEALSCLPTLLFFVRCIYAIVVLIKMHMAVMQPNSEVGKIIKTEDIKAEEYLDRIYNLFQEMSKHDLVKPHHKVLMILNIVREWFLMHKDGPNAQKEAAGTSANGAPHGRYPHGQASNKLQVLSEAATAGAPSPAPGRSNSDRTDSTNQPWTFDSPSAISYQQPNRSNTAPSPASYGSSSNTPRHGSASTPNNYTGYNLPGMSSADNSKSQYNPTAGDAYDGSTLFGMAGNMDNLDWTAGMNLEQVLDGAFREIDMSGDLGNWFLGDGVNAYQLPADGSIGEGKW